MYIKQGRGNGWDRKNIYVCLLDRCSQEGSGAELGNTGHESARNSEHQDGGMGFTLAG